LREIKPAETLAVFARAVGREDERVTVTALASADPGLADMQTLIIIGSRATKILARGGEAEPWVYTPRAMEL
jgi:precorrin-3B C17-methyltransferase